MTIEVTHLFADPQGETHLATIALPTRVSESGVGLSRIEIPTTTAIFVEYLDAFPDHGLHCAPRRQFAQCLRGAFEVTTTTGESKVLGPGEWLLADDLDSKGHLTRGVGSESRVNLAIGIADGWELPAV